MPTHLGGDGPRYDEYTDMRAVRGPLGAAFARQAVATSLPELGKPVHELDVLDVGSGYGFTSLALAEMCGSVVALEPATPLHEFAVRAAERLGLGNLTFRHGGIADLDEVERFDLVVLDNVYEHLPDHSAALSAIVRSMRPGGVLYLLVPNRLWPMEAHYRLPLLSWMPLRWANLYLRLTRRGSDYTDASYAPTYWSLVRRLREQPELRFRFVLPADPAATVAGAPWHYRLGMAALRRAPCLWAISKAMLVVAVKERGHPDSPGLA